MVLAVVAAGIIVALPLAAIFLHLPQNPLQPDVESMALAPNSVHWFGTDGNGMDVFSRTIESARLDLPISLAATAIALVIGVPLGLFATTGVAGEAIMRVVDAFAALPIIVIAVVSIQLMGGGATDVILAIALVAAPRFVRLSRAAAISLRSSRYVEAAVAIGCSPIRVAFNHIFRNAYGVILVQATLTTAGALSTIAALNFLGVGVKPPQPSWGAMIEDGVSMLIRGGQSPFRRWPSSWSSARSTSSPVPLRTRWNEWSTPDEQDPPSPGTRSRVPYSPGCGPGVAWRFL
jgi:peptide/nickel transport system permease protein